MAVGLGDYLDFTRTSYRAAYRAVGGEDDKFFQELDDMVMHTYVYPFVENIRKRCPTFAKKCYGFVEGNHHGKMLSHKFQNGTTTTQVICGLLGVRYLGLSAWLRLTVYRSKGSTKFGSGHNLNILVNHGGATGSSLGTSLNSATRKLVGWRGVDVFLTAHDHQLGHDKIQQIGVTSFDQPRMMQHEVLIGKVGSFQKGYTEGAESDSYVEKKLMRPSMLGWLSFDARIRQTGNREDGKKSPEVWGFSNFSV